MGLAGAPGRAGSTAAALSVPSALSGSAGFGAPTPTHRYGEILNRLARLGGTRQAAQPRAGSLGGLGTAGSPQYLDNEAVSREAPGLGLYIHELQQITGNLDVGRHRAVEAYFDAEVSLVRRKKWPSSPIRAAGPHRETRRHRRPKAWYESRRASRGARLRTCAADGPGQVRIAHIDKGGRFGTRPRKIRRLESPTVRLTSLFAPTLKDDPADAEVASHKLLVRAGMIRQVARGIYDYLPLGLRVLRRIEALVREELDRAGCQEVLLPAVCPAELWQESGRWEHYGKELLRIRDRNDRDFCFGPTHEEVVTDLVRGEVRSYRDLPKNLYQVQTKFRDEVRPRFGLMRGREFLMKDGYSFHASFEDAEREYYAMYAVYERIFSRCGLEFRAVEADTGAIGGSLSHEFQVLAASGEDEIAACDSCGYAANIEKAEVGRPAEDALSEEASEELARIATPDQRTIEDVSSYLDLPVDRFLKTLLFTQADGTTVAALVRGDHQLSEAKLRAFLGTDALTMAEPDVVEAVTGAPVGFAGPVGLEVPIVADHALHGIEGAVAGANEADAHITGVSHSRDFGANVRFADLRLAAPGDACPRCEGGHFAMHRGIEVGQVFYLGTKYSEALGATFLDPDGREQPLEMGCYGIGISRTLAAAVEQSHDENGIIWPMPLAPFAVQIVPTKMKDEAIAAAATELYEELCAARIDVLLDDRDERPGVKFKDADLVGTPLRVTIGPRGLEKGIVELRDRASGETEEIPRAEAVGRLTARIEESR